MSHPWASTHVHDPWETTRVHNARQCDKCLGHLGKSNASLGGQSHRLTCGPCKGIIKARLAACFPEGKACCAGCWVNRGIQNVIQGCQYVLGHEEHKKCFSDENGIPSCSECEALVGEKPYWPVMMGEISATNGMVYTPVGSDDEVFARFEEYQHILGRNGEDTLMQSDDLHEYPDGVIKVIQGITCTKRAQNSRIDDTISEYATARSALARLKASLPVAMDVD